MAIRRRKAARRRSAGGRNGLPGWAWLLTGALLALGVVVLAPGYFKSDGVDGFFRASPDAVPQPPISTLEHSVPPPATGATPLPADVPAADTQPPPAAPPVEPDYDFYTILPEQETVTSTGAADAAELAEAAPVRPAAASTPPAASPPARPAAPPAERPAASPAALPRPPASATRTPTTAPAASAARPAAEHATPAAAADSTTSAATATAPTGSGQRTVLQAGAFRAAGDAEALKARIALLGLQARVEAGSVDGQAVYRVRLGPYANARDLATARQRLDNDGLPSREIRGQ